MQTKKQQWRRMSTNTLIVRKRSSSLSPPSSPSSATNLLLKEDDESIPVLRAISHDSYMNKIASCTEHTTTKAKSVRFCPKVHVVLVPQAQEYHDAKLSDSLWWDDESYGYFKQSAVDEIVAYMVSNNCPNMTAKQVLAAIYNSNNSNATPQDAFLFSDIAESSCGEDCENSPESLPSPQSVTQLSTTTTDQSPTTSKATDNCYENTIIALSSTETSQTATVIRTSINSSISGSCCNSGSTGSMLERLASYTASQSACNNDMYEKLASLSLISCSY